MQWCALGSRQIWALTLFSAPASVQLGNVSDIHASVPDGRVLFVGHSIAGGVADLQDAVAQEQDLWVLCCWVAALPCFAFERLYM